MNAEPQTSVELWIWPLKEFIEANDAVKDKTRTDLVTLTQLAGSGRKIAQQIRLLGTTGLAYVKEGANGKKYIIFKGNPAMRPNLSGTRYLRDNPKVSSFVVGTEEIIEDTSKGTKVAIIAFVIIDVIKECMADHFSMASLGVNVLSDVAQAAVGAAASIAVGAFFVTAGLPIIVTFAAVVVVGAAVGFALAELDHRFQLTERARTYMMRLENTQGTWLNRAEHALTDAADGTGRMFRSAEGYVGRAWRDGGGAGGLSSMMLVP